MILGSFLRLTMFLGSWTVFSRVGSFSPLSLFNIVLLLRIAFIFDPTATDTLLIIQQHCCPQETQTVITIFTVQEYRQAPPIPILIQIPYRRLNLNLPTAHPGPSWSYELEFELKSEGTVWSDLVDIRYQILDIPSQRTNETYGFEWIIEQNQSLI